MTFLEAPCNIPLTHHFPDRTWIEGKKAIVLGELVLVTPARTFLYMQRNNNLMQVVPFKVDITIPADGWEITQLRLEYPRAAE